MNYVLASHGEFAQGLAEAVKMIAGGDDIETFSMTSDKSLQQANEEIENLLNKMKGDKLVVFTDLMGGSVNNLFTEFLLKGFEFDLIVGMNLPLVLSAVMQSEFDVDTVINDAKDSIIHVNKLLPKTQHKIGG